jgi:hypothetical protein
MARFLRSLGVEVPNAEIMCLPSSAVSQLPMRTPSRRAPLHSANSGRQIWA